MKKLMSIIIILVLITIAAVVGWFIGKRQNSEITIGQITSTKPKPLDKYTIENLSKTEIDTGKIEINDVLSEEATYTSYQISFLFNPNLDGKTMKKTTGQLNLPSGPAAKKFPLVIMLRGYIDKETYKTGDGTRKAASVFTENGFITMAPDFLGYAGSDQQAENIFEARFQTYVTVLSLLKSLSAIEQSTDAKALADKWDNETIFLWGHSNGGQIALTYLEITETDYPTTLWAPVSKPFPYSVLFYTDESEDRGKLIRYELAKFEKLYEPDLYSIDLYIDRIEAPLIIHQGTSDTSVPSTWSDELAKLLEDNEKEVNYFKYAGTNHNMVPSWNVVVNRDIEFFRSNQN